ncbi:MAG: hypothetical protein DRH49_00340 [Candidatus Coatesbacteria bacterium]|nr:MAG: hypothetical protein DRH49_00340 [Candidatus Coatesbacteria bacterium]
MFSNEKEKLEAFKNQLNEILRKDNLNIKQRNKLEITELDNAREHTINNQQFLLFEKSATSHIIPDIEELMRYISLFSTPSDLIHKDLVFLDIETCGSSEGAIILVGVVLYDDEEPKVVQALARDYSEEQAIIEYMTHILEGRRVFITYNGKLFDIPAINLRCTLYQLKPLEPTIHIDLLNIARKRIPKRRLPNRKLTTLEYYLLDFEREADIPGRLIPSIYHNFTRTGDASGLARVIEHNAWDVISMVNLVPILLSVDSPKIEEIKNYWWGR